VSSNICELVSIEVEPIMKIRNLAQLVGGI